MAKSYTLRHGTHSFHVEIFFQFADAEEEDESLPNVD